VSPKIDLVGYLRIEMGEGVFRDSGQAVTPVRYGALENLLMSLPDLKPKSPIKVMGVDSSKTDTAKAGIAESVHGQIRFVNDHCHTGWI